jgi:protein phosphatase
VRFLPGNAQHTGERATQQDAFGFSDPDDVAFARHAGLVAVLADGMGGLERGEEASRLAVRTFLAAYREKAPETGIPEALQTAAHRANSAVPALGGAAGSTLVAAALWASELHWVAAGDSALYLWRKGTLTLMNTAHVYARTLDRAVAAGALSADEALADPQRESLTSYLGAGDTFELDWSVRAFPLEPGDRVVLASDGLFKTLAESDIATALSRGGAQETSEALVRAAIDRAVPGQDNVTVLIVDVSDERPRRLRRALKLGIATLVMVAGAGACWLYLR